MIVSLAVQGSVGPSALGVLAHVAYYAGLLGLLGSWVVATYCWNEPPRILMRWMPAVWTLALLGAVGIAELNRSDIGVGFVDFFGTHLGHAALGRIAPLLVAHEGVIVARVAQEKARRNGLHVVAAGAAVSVAGHLAASHAAGGYLAAGKVLLQWVHVLTVSVWIGGLGALLLTVGRTPDDEKARAVRRFSTVAGIAIVVVALTGFARALNEVNGIDALVRTTYGRLVIAKTELLLGIAILGAVNRYRHVTEAGSSLRGLRKAGAGELVVAAVVLTLSGMLSGTAPAREAIVSQVHLLRPVSVTVSPGDVKIFVFKYGDGSTMQAYGEGGTPGLTEVHATFISAKNREERMRSVELQARKGSVHLSGAGRELSPGHFVIDLQLDRGTWRFNFVAVRSDGVKLEAQLTFASR